MIKFLKIESTNEYGPRVSIFVLSLFLEALFISPYKNVYIEYKYNTNFVNPLSGFDATFIFIG
jgi:hypothetical protein